jgi:hypothetical protein
MTFLKTRESAEVETSAETEMEGEIRDFVRRDVATSLRRQPESDSEVVATNIGALLQRVAGTSVQEIEKLIGELQTLRDMLQTEAARVQREIVEYATLSQAAMQSTKIIAESLTQWKKVLDAPVLRGWFSLLNACAPASAGPLCFCRGHDDRRVSHRRMRRVAA